MFIASRAYKVLGLIRCSFSSSLDFKFQSKEEPVSSTSSISTYLWITDLEATSYEGLYFAGMNTATCYKVYFERLPVRL